MTILVNLFIRSVIEESYYIDNKYHMTLNYVIRCSSINDEWSA